ncbi:MAG: hypothetical protein RML12_04035 [Xanthomonadales bacterium]|nr:hypothetical protein [Xanthomonadales bacterium]
MLKRSVLALALLAALPAAQASELSYNFLEIGLGRIDPEGAGSSDTWGLEGSLGVTENFFLRARYEQLDAPGSNPDGWSIGAGVNLAIGDSTDFVLAADYGDSEGLDFWNVDGGVRTAFGESFEGWFGVGYTDPEGGSGDFYGFGRLHLRFNEALGATLNLQLGDDATSYGVGLRVTF